MFGNVQIACPQCRDIGSVRKATEMVQKTLSTATNVDTGHVVGGVRGDIGVRVVRTALSDRLQPPAEPQLVLLPSSREISHALMGIAIILGGAAGGLLLVGFGVLDNGPPDKVAKIVGLIVVVMAMTCVHESRQAARQRSSEDDKVRKENQRRATEYEESHAEWKRQMERWRRLFYCARCDGVFVQGERVVIPVENAHGALRQRASDAAQ